MNTKTQEHFMQLALDQAQQAYASNEVPIGAIIVCQDQIIAQTHNTCEANKNALKHAEIKALEEATTNKNNWRLDDCDLYVTLEPCPMCLGALFQARIKKLYIGCFDPKRETASYCQSLKGMAQLKDNNHTLEIHSPLLESECSEVLRDFFKKRRNENGK